jgi:hypothetical protein
MLLAAMMLLHPKYSVQTLTLSAILSPPTDSDAVTVSRIFHSGAFCSTIPSRLVVGYQKVTRFVLGWISVGKLWC